MSGLRMVPLTQVATSFEARLLAARLGADGILWELRGNFDGPYPGIGGIEILVPADQLDEASGLLSSAGAPEEPGAGAPWGDDGLALVDRSLRTRRWVAVAVAAWCVAFLVFEVLSLG